MFYLAPLQPPAFADEAASEAASKKALLTWSSGSPKPDGYLGGCRLAARFFAGDLVGAGSAFAGGSAGAVVGVVLKEI